MGLEVSKTCQEDCCHRRPRQIREPNEYSNCLQCMELKPCEIHDIDFEIAEYKKELNDFVASGPEFGIHDPVERARVCRETFFELGLESLFRAPYRNRELQQLDCLEEAVRRMMREQNGIGNRTSLSGDAQASERSLESSSDRNDVLRRGESEQARSTAFPDPPCIVVTAPTRFTFEDSSTEVREFPTLEASASGASCSRVSVCGSHCYSTSTPAGPQKSLRFSNVSEVDEPTLASSDEDTGGDDLERVSERLRNLILKCRKVLNETDMSLTLIAGDSLYDSSQEKSTSSCNTALEIEANFGRRLSTVIEVTEPESSTIEPSPKRHCSASLSTASTRRQAHHSESRDSAGLQVSPPKRLRSDGSGSSLTALTPGDGRRVQLTPSTVGPMEVTRFARADDSFRSTADIATHLLRAFDEFAAVFREGMTQLIRNEETNRASNSDKRGHRSWP